MASLSVAIAAAVIVTALGLSLGIRKKLGGELRAYGANIVVAVKEGYIDESGIPRVKAIKGVEDVSGQIYETVSVDGRAVEVIGLQIEKTAGWRITGRQPLSKEVLAGVDLKEALALKEGSVLKVQSGGVSSEIKISGFVERGGAEDRAIIMSSSDAQVATGRQGKLSALLIRSASGAVESVVMDIKKILPDAEVKTLRQVAMAEESFLRKIELLMGLVALVVMTASGISVSSTMAATVLERLKEIGLMKALGGTNRSIGMFYIVEAGVIGLAGGLAGFIVGYAGAQAVSRWAFGSFIEVSFYLLMLSLCVGVAVAVVASVIPMRPALVQRPSEILRGE